MGFTVRAQTFLPTSERQSAVIMRQVIATTLMLGEQVRRILPRKLRTLQQEEVSRWTSWNSGSLDRGMLGEVMQCFETKKLQCTIIIYQTFGTKHLGTIL